MVFCW